TVKKASARQMTLKRATNGVMTSMPLKRVAWAGSMRTADEAKSKPAAATPEQRPDTRSFNKPRASTRRAVTTRTASGAARRRRSVYDIVTMLELLHGYI